MFFKIFLSLFAITLLVTFAKCDKENSDWEFLRDFFEKKNVKIAMHVCWSKESIHNFYKYFFNEKNTNEIGVFQNLDYFINKNVNNYLMMDLRNCESSWKLLEQANDEELFRFPYKYLVIISEIEFERFRGLLKNYSIYVDSEIIVAIKINEENFQLRQPYRVNNFDDIINWEKYGSWFQQNGLVEYLASKSISDRRKNFKQTILRAGFFMVNNDTWNHLEDSRFPNIDPFTKQTYQTVKSLFEYCNISAVKLSFSDNQYYEFQENKNSGLVFSLHKKEIDIAGSPIVFIPQRIDLLDFIKMVNPLPVKFVLKKPSLSFMRNIFILPFESRVWYALAIVSFLFFMVLYVIMNWECKMRSQPFERQKFSGSDMWLLVLEGICQQGTVMDPKRVPGKVLQFMMFLSFMFLYTSFSAFIIILLQSTVTVMTWKELSESRIKVGAQYTSYMKYYMSGTQNQFLQQIYKKKIFPDGFYTVEEGMKQVGEGSFAFHAEYGQISNYMMEYFSDYETCGMQEIDGFLEYLKGYITLPKNSPYKKIFKIALMRIEEHGIQQRSISLYQRIPHCFSGGGSFDSVGIVDMIQVLLIWAYGLALGIVFFVIEQYVHAHRKRIEKIKGFFKNRGSHHDKLGYFKKKKISEE